MNKTTTNKKYPRLSCLILCCDSHINKGSSIFHCVASVLNQNYQNFEVIIFENSHVKSDPIKLQEFCEKINRKREKPVPIKLINNIKSISVGAARNKAAARAKGEVLVFIDDDTILLNSNAFTTVAELSRSHIYGFGATRLWTNKMWFQNHSTLVLNQVINRHYKDILSHCGKPFPGVRNEKNIDLQLKTFIANFGFCDSKIFKKIGGFPDYKGYGYEDDCLMFKLFRLNYTHSLLSNLTVVHINHSIVKSKERSLIPYHQYLIKHNVYWFHVAKLFKNSKVKLFEAIETLNPLHYDPRLEEVYHQYLFCGPLDIKSRDIKKINSWSTNNKYSRIEFARTMALLQSSSTINEFVQNSQADFDNLGPIIKIAVDHNFIKISAAGKITRIFNFTFTQPYTNVLVEKNKLIPKKKFNQFPCDENSRLNRLQLLKERYPYAEYLKVGIIGDDDLLSVQLKNDFWVWPIVVEKDINVIRAIKKDIPRAEVVNMDVLDYVSPPKNPVQTFITDPPYTLDGALAFITAGLSMLSRDSEEKEFYVIMNARMMGGKLNKLQSILNRSGVYLSETFLNFSRYKLPKNFSENTRAKKLLKSLKIPPEVLQYSSSSNLYIFKTKNPNIEKLRQAIKHKQIYAHY
jgi:glycosyltransferase involved in cell wall biosynthesis